MEVSRTLDHILHLVHSILCYLLSLWLTPVYFLFPSLFICRTLVVLHLQVWRLSIARICYWELYQFYLLSASCFSDLCLVTCLLSDILFIYALGNGSVTASLWVSEGIYCRILFSTFPWHFYPSSGGVTPLCYFSTDITILSFPWRGDTYLFLHLEYYY